MMTDLYHKLTRKMCWFYIKAMKTIKQDFIMFTSDVFISCLIKDKNKSTKYSHKQKPDVLFWVISYSKSKENIFTNIYKV